MQTAKRLFLGNERLTNEQCGMNLVVERLTFAGRFLEKTDRIMDRMNPADVMSVRG